MILNSCNTEGDPFNLSNKNIIKLQPFVDFEKKDALEAKHFINQYFENVVIGNAISFPNTAYIKKRNRYRADSLLRYLLTTRKEDTIAVGLTNFDISTTKGHIEDWGVMGLGYRPGKACLISTFRLHKSNMKQQFFKVVLHEIGHTLNLPHCENKTCLMRDAEGGNPLDSEKDFCFKCKKKLVARGMKLKPYLSTYSNNK